MLASLGYKVSVLVEIGWERSYWPLTPERGDPVRVLPYLGGYPFSLYLGSVPLDSRGVARRGLEGAAEDLLESLLNGLSRGSIVSRYLGVVLADYASTAGVVGALHAYALAGGFSHIYTVGLECPPTPWFYAGRLCGSVRGDYAIVGDGVAVGEGVHGTEASLLAGTRIVARLTRLLGLEEPADLAKPDALLLEE
jgi:hypothetical protein